METANANLSKCAETGDEWTEPLDTHGFVGIPGIVDEARLAELEAAFDAIAPAEGTMHRGGTVYAMRNLLAEIPAVRRLAESEPILSLVRRILGSNAFPARGLWFDKSAGANWLVPWHQDLTIAVKRRVDAAHYGPWTVKGGIPHVRPPVAVLKKMLTVRVHLDDSDSQRGPLRVIPGSHAAGRLDANATRDWLARVPAVSCLVPRGGVLLMRPLILHASSPAESDGRRRVIHLEYAAEPLPGGVAWFESES